MASYYLKCVNNDFAKLYPFVQKIFIVPRYGTIYNSTMLWRFLTYWIITTDCDREAIAHDKNWEPALLLCHSQLVCYKLKWADHMKVFGLLGWTETFDALVLGFSCRKHIYKKIGDIHLLSDHMTLSSKLKSIIL